MNALYQKKHSRTGIILLLLSFLLLSGILRQVNCTAEQVRLISASQEAPGSRVVPSFRHTLVYIVLPYTKEAKGMSEEQQLAYMQNIIESIKCISARFAIYALLLFVLAFSAAYITRILFYASLSACCSQQHAIISYIHAQDGQK